MAAQICSATDTVAGGPGNDRIYAADHTPDSIDGGLGVDHAHADPTNNLTSATTPLSPSSTPAA
jgi:hypothetical protein